MTRTPEYSIERQTEYPGVGDTVDSICKTLAHIIAETNVSNCEEFLALQDKRNAIKAKYPKGDNDDK